MRMRRADAARSCSSLSAAFTRLSSRSSTSTELSSKAVEVEHLRLVR
jgi:hypothetical protein